MRSDRESMKKKKAKVAFRGQSHAGFTGLIVGGCFAFVLSTSLAVAQEENAAQATEPLAIFAGQPIGTDQLSPRDESQLLSMEGQVFAVRRSALQAVLDRKLIESAAKAKGMSVEDFLKTEVDEKVPEPTEAELHTYYDQNKAHENKPFEDAKSEVRFQVRAAAIDKARHLYIDSLTERALDNGELKILVHPPRFQLPVDPTRVKGNPKAPVTIVEFADFSSRSSQKAESTITQILARYPDKIKLGFRDFPFEAIRPGARLAAEASRCAAEQGKFWEYHDILFANLGRQEREDLIQYADQLKLDSKQFAECLNTNKDETLVDHDFQMGFHVGVQAPPGFFINGEFLDGAQPPEAFEKIIERDLAGDQSHASN
jgi:protein-disulfide isomerase